MAHGCRKGENRGQGRKKGVPNKNRREVFAKAKEMGVEPIQVAIEAANYVLQKARIEPDEDKRVALYKELHNMAIDIAPYFHRKMPTALETKNTDEETFEQMVIRLDKEAQEARKLLGDKA